MSYHCQKCGASVPDINQLVHDLHCRGPKPKESTEESVSKVPASASECSSTAEEDKKDEELVGQALDQVRYPGQSNESWSCKRCTLENPKSLIICTACGMSQKSEPVTSDAKWTCPTCTYLNATSEVRCEMCGTSSSNSEHVVEEDEEGVRAPDRGRRERLVERPPPLFQFGQMEGHNEDENFDRSSAQLHRLMFSTVAGGLMGGVSAYANDRSLARGALEGATFGALTSSILNELESLTDDDRPSQTSFGSAQMQQQEEHPGNSSFRGRGRIRFNGEEIDFDHFLRLFMSHRGFEGAESMDYESLLARFGDGSPNRQASEETLASIPSRPYEDDQTDKDENERASCAICLGDFKKGEQVSTLPCCHSFHEDCCKQWLRNVNSCPVCKVEVP